MLLHRANTASRSISGAARRPQCARRAPVRVEAAKKGGGGKEKKGAQKKGGGALADLLKKKAEGAGGSADAELATPAQVRAARSPNRYGARRLLTRTRALKVKRALGACERRACGPLKPWPADPGRIDPRLCGGAPQGAGTSVLGGPGPLPFVPTPATPIRACDSLPLLLKRSTPTQRSTSCC